MKLLKKMFMSVAMLAFANAATAATYDLGTSEYPTDAGGSINLTIATDGTGYFEDIFNFTSKGISGSWFAQADDASAVSFEFIDLFVGSDADLGADLFGPTWVAGFADTKSGREVYMAEGSGFALDPYTDYSVVVSGYSYIAGDTYNFTSGPVSAVPEPAVLAMMLGGLGMVGFMANRRRKELTVA